MTEEHRGYDPADFKAVEDTAKTMSKQELEIYYVEDKNNKYRSPGAETARTIGVLLGLAFFVFMIGAAGYYMAEGNILNEVHTNIDIVESDICPILGIGYISDEIFGEAIMCDQFNSALR